MRRAEDVAARVAEMYAMDWSPAGTECPIGYAMKVEDRRQIAEQFGGAL